MISKLLHFLGFCCLHILEEESCAWHLPLQAALSWLACLISAGGSQVAWTVGFFLLFLFALLQGCIPLLQPLFTEVTLFIELMCVPV